MTVDTKILDRIAKLLALAKGGTTEGEANAAMGKAQELMAEHNLTLANLEAASGDRGSRVKETQHQSLMYKWKRELLEDIAKVNFCALVIQYGTTRAGEKIATGYELIGRPANVTVVRHMFAYLLSAVERVLVNEVGTSPQARFNRWSHSFRQGCSERLRDRLRERYEATVREKSREAREANARSHHPGSTGNALVVVFSDFVQEEQDLNNDVLRGWAPGTTARNRQSWKAEIEARTLDRKNRAEKLRKQHPGQPPLVISLMLDGASLEEAIKASAKYDKPETDAQRRKREEADERYWRRRQEQEDRKNRYRRSDGFRAGQRKGDTISLDEQVDEKGADQRLTGE